MKIAIYARESSADTTKAPPIEAQIERGKQWATENNHEVLEIFVDNGFSGGDWKRPDWNKAVRMARSNQYRILWVWNQDRLARDTEQFLWFYRQLQEKSVRIFEDTSNDFIDMETLGGRVKHQSLAQAGEIFRLVTSEKVKKAYERKKARGEKWGRNKLFLDDDLLIKLYNIGGGWRSIAKAYNEAKDTEYSYSTIRRHLQNLLDVSQ